MAGGPGGRGPGGPGGPGGGGPGGPGTPGGGPRKRRRPRLRKALKIGGLAVAVLILLGIATVGLIYVRTDVPDPNALPTNQIATIYYSDGRTEMAKSAREPHRRHAGPGPEAGALRGAGRGEPQLLHRPGHLATGIVRAAFNNVTGGSTAGRLDDHPAVREERVH